MAAQGPQPMDSSEHGFFFLNQDQFENLNEDEALYAVDIVAIHGISGHAHETWRHQNGKIWLRDFLPLDLPGCRVFTYGYPSEIAFDSSGEKLEGVGYEMLLELTYKRTGRKEQSRPIIFLAHSIGGILVKQAMHSIIAYPSYYTAISDSLCGVIFLGTPHRHSHSASFSETLDYVALATSNEETESKMRSCVEANCELLEKISSKFKDELPFGMEILSCIEQNTTPGFKSKIVDNMCGWMNSPQEEVLLISSNHLDICRFENEKCVGYRDLLSWIQNVLSS